MNEKMYKGKYRVIKGKKQVSENNQLSEKKTHVGS